MSKHTPGPWRVEVLDDTSRLSLPRGPIYLVLSTIQGYPSTVCTVEEYSEVPGFEAPRAIDAKLIAAAPDLLEALQAMLDVCFDLERNDETLAAVKKSLAAIMKATGETK